MNEWKIEGSRVYRDGKSFNCTNKVTAVDLHHILNTYEQVHQLNRNIEEQYDRITKQVIQIKLSIGTLTEEINKLSEAIQCLKSK